MGRSPNSMNQSSSLLGKRIARTVVIQIAAKAIDTALAVVAFGMITRSLNAEGYGAFTIVTSFLQLFGILADLGLSLVAIQMMSEVGRDEEKNFNTIFTFRMITVALCLGSAPLVALFFPYSPLIKLGIFGMTFSFFLTSLAQLLRIIYQVHLRADIPSAADLLSRIVLLPLLALAYWQAPGNVFAIFGAITASNLAQAWIMVARAGTFVRIRLAWERSIVREMMHRTWPIALSIAFNLIYLRTDTIILSLSHSEYVVGLYGAAYRILDVLVSIPAIFMATTLAQFSYRWSQLDKEGFQRAMQVSFNVLSLIACPLVVGTWFISRPLMAFVAGSEFGDSGPVLNILIVASGIIFFSSFFGHLINVIHAQKTAALWYGICALVGMGGYLFFIPRFGPFGAAGMTVGVELLVLVCIAWVFFQKSKICLSLGGLFRSLAASGAMALILFTWKDLSLFALIGIGALSYTSALFLLGGLPKELRATLSLP